MVLSTKVLAFQEQAIHVAKLTYNTTQMNYVTSLLTIFSEDNTY